MLCFFFGASGHLERIPQTIITTQIGRSLRRSRVKNEARLRVVTSLHSWDHAILEPSKAKGARIHNSLECKSNGVQR